MIFRFYYRFKILWFFFSFRSLFLSWDRFSWGTLPLSPALKWPIPTLISSIKDILLEFVKKSCHGDPLPSNGSAASRLGTLSTSGLHTVVHYRHAQIAMTSSTACTWHRPFHHISIKKYFFHICFAHFLRFLLLPKRVSFLNL